MQAQKSQEMAKFIGAQLLLYETDADEFKVMLDVPRLLHHNEESCCSLSLSPCCSYWKVRLRERERSTRKVCFAEIRELFNCCPVCVGLVDDEEYMVPGNHEGE